MSYLGVDLTQFVFFAAGLAMLIVSSDMIVNAARRFAERIGISELVIGLAIISVGTSLPELATSLNAGFHNMVGIDASGIAVGNVIGANIANITVTLGIVGLMGVLVLREREWYRDFGTMLAAVGMMYIFASDAFISPLEGFALVAIYLAYAHRLLGGFRKEEISVRISRQDLRDFGIGALGLLALIYGSNLVVENGIRMASSLGLDKVAIGLIIGLGTSLPEMTVAVTAIRRKSNPLGVGTLIGSTIINPTLVLGMGAMVAGFRVSQITLSFDMPVLFVVSGLVAVLFGLHERLRKPGAALLILIYALFMFTRMTM